MGKGGKHWGGEKVEKCRTSTIKKIFYSQTIQRMCHKEGCLHLTAWLSKGEPKFWDLYGGEKPDKSLVKSVARSHAFAHRLT